MTKQNAILATMFMLAAASVQAQVNHGSELKRGENCGIPEGTNLQPSSETVIKSPEVITGKIFGALKTTHSDGVVKFVNCRFVNPGYVPLTEGDLASPGTVSYTVQRAGTGSVELENCEVFGGKSVAILGVDKVTRTYVAGGNDLIRVPKGESIYTEVLGEQLIMSSPASHSDILQVTFGKDQTADDPAVADIHLIRCKFDARGRVDGEGKSLDGVNGAIQLGSFGPNTGVKGEITNCFFEGGAFTLAGGDRGDAGKPIVLRGNQFGRLGKYGAMNPNWRKNHDVDESNVWADTGAPARGKP